jgi:protein-tyrosine phosphatase
VDIVCLHNHLMPGVDDGAESAGDAEDALVAMRDQGVGLVVATPHIDGSITTRPAALRERLEVVDRGWRELRAIGGVPEVRIGRGAEILLDSPRIDLDDPRLRLAGGPAVLVEMVWTGFPPGVDELLYHLRMDGFLPVLAHPERYRELQGPRGAERLSRWRDWGVVLQVNASSLVGDHGRQVRKVAWSLLAAGRAQLVCSDHHPRPGRLPALRDAFDRVASRGGDQAARTLFDTNPRLALKGEELRPVPPLRSRRFRVPVR